jgi:hypothetical protein
MGRWSDTLEAGDEPGLGQRNFRTDPRSGGGVGRSRPPKKSKFAIRPARQNRCAPFLLLPQRKPTRYLLETQREAMKQKTDVQQRTLGLALRES